MKSLLVDQVVGGGLIKGVVKVEDLVVQVLGKVHLLFWLMNEQGTFSRYRHHIYLLSINLWETEECQSQLMMTNLFAQSLIILLYSVDTVYRMLAFISIIPCLLRGRLRTHTQILWGSIYKNTRCTLSMGYNGTPAYMVIQKVHGSSV